MGVRSSYKVVCDAPGCPRGTGGTDEFQFRSEALRCAKKLGWKRSAVDGMFFCASCWEARVADRAKKKVSR